jgi:hypothetical protein
MLLAVCTLLHIFVVLLAPPAVGAVLVRRLERILFPGLKTPLSELNVNVLYIIGLVWFLLVALLLKMADLPWAAATYVPLSIVLLERGSITASQRFLRVDPSLNFVAWFFVVVATGLSLLSTVDGIQTAWVNNYGDATFHIGMISSFVFGGNIPPEYHIFEGVRLSYPFLMNFWSALCWWPDASWHVLALIFAAQWTVLWVLVYRFLSGSKYFFIPWAVFLGGGCYGLLGTMSTDSLQNGYPWGVFISTIWAPQRTFLLGLACMLGALWIVFRGLSTVVEQSLEESVDRERTFRLLLLAVILPVSLLCHGHSTLVVVCFLVLVYGTRYLLTLFRPDREPLFKTSSLVLVCSVAIFTTLIVAPWLIGKSGILHVAAGWSGKEDFRGKRIGTRCMIKNPKHQIPNKSQSPNAKRSDGLTITCNGLLVWFGVWKLRFRIYLRFGACDLLFQVDTTGSPIKIRSFYKS